jgi:hypothetical protein
MANTQAADRMASLCNVQCTTERSLTSQHALLVGKAARHLCRQAGLSSSCAGSASLGICSMVAPATKCTSCCPVAFDNSSGQNASAVEQPNTSNQQGEQAAQLPRLTAISAGAARHYCSCRCRDVTCRSRVTVGIPSIWSDAQRLRGPSGDKTCFCHRYGSPETATARAAGSAHVKMTCTESVQQVRRCVTFAAWHNNGGAAARVMHWAE